MIELSPTPRVSVIIVSWNGRHHLVRCLEALETQTFRSFEMVVVDNASTDGTVELLAGRFPQVRLLRNATNLGFAAANNVGIRATTGQYVATLNNDTLADPSWLSALVRTADADPSLGSVASKMVFAHDPATINSCGIALDPAGIAWDLWGGRPARLVDRPREVFGPCAGAALYRRVMLDDVGLFDENFFAYSEDVDLAWRARLRGWRCIFQPDAVVQHAHSGTLGEGSPLKRYLLARNKVWVVVKCAPTEQLRRRLPVILLYDVGAATFGVLHQRDWASVRGRLAGLRALPALLAKRREIQGRRTAPHGSLTSLYAPLAMPWDVPRRYRHLVAMLPATNHGAEPAMPVASRRGAEDWPHQDAPLRAMESGARLRPSSEGGNPEPLSAVRLRGLQLAGHLLAPPHRGRSAGENPDRWRRPKGPSAVNHVRPGGSLSKSQAQDLGLQPASSAERELRPQLMTTEARTGERPLRRAAMPGTASPRVVVLRPDHLGDLLLSRPAIEMLRHSLPAATLTVIVGPWGLPSLQGLDVRVITFPFPAFTRTAPSHRLAAYGALLVFAARLRAERFDAALILRRDHWWGALAAALAGIPLRVGHATPETAPFLTDAIPLASAASHVPVAAAQASSLLLERLGIPGRTLLESSSGANALQVRFEPSVRALADAQRWLDGNLGHRRPRVAIHPGAGAGVKTWPARRWAAIARALDAEGAEVVLTGGDDELALVTTVRAGAGLAAPPATSLSWDALAALYRQMDLVLGMDSGPLHLAAAVGTPTVRIYGPTDPAIYGPAGSVAAHAVLQSSLPCAPCGNLVAPPCGSLQDPPCLASVPVDRVVAVVRAQLGAVSVP